MSPEPEDYWVSLSVQSRRHLKSSHDVTGVTDTRKPCHFLRNPRHDLNYLCLKVEPRFGCHYQNVNHFGDREVTVTKVTSVRIPDTVSGRVLETCPNGNLPQKSVTV